MRRFLSVFFLVIALPLRGQHPAATNPESAITDLGLDAMDSGDAGTAAGRSLSNSTAGPAKAQNNVRFASQYDGSDAGAQLSACIADLPSTGGTCDSRGLEGLQTVSTDVFSSVTKPVRLMLGAATYVISATTTIPANISVNFSEGASFSVSSGVTVTINGNILATISNIFTYNGTGKVVLGGRNTRQAFPQWWGAKGDGAQDDTTAITNAMNAINPSGNAGPGGAVFFPPGTYVINSTLQPQQAVTLVSGGSAYPTMGAVIKAGASFPSCQPMFRNSSGFQTEAVSIRHLAFDGANVADGIWLQTSNLAQFDDVFIRKINTSATCGVLGIGGWGLTLYATTGQSTSNSEFNNIVVTGAFGGFHIAGTTPAAPVQHAHFYHLRFQGVNHGVFIENAVASGACCGVGQISIRDLMGDIASSHADGPVRTLVSGGLRRSNNTATGTCSSTCGFTAGQSVIVSGSSDNTFNGYYGVASASGTTFTYNNAGPDTSGTGGNSAQAYIYPYSRTLASNGLERRGNIVTGTCPAACGFTAGQLVVISGSADTSFNGTYGIVSASAAKFAYHNSGPNTGAVGGTSIVAQQLGARGVRDTSGNNSYLSNLNVENTTGNGIGYDFSRAGVISGEYHNVYCTSGFATCLAPDNSTLLQVDNLGILVTGQLNLPSFQQLPDPSLATLGPADTVCWAGTAGTPSGSLRCSIGAGAPFNVVGDNLTQTLTHKTLDGLTINHPIIQSRLVNQAANYALASTDSGTVFTNSGAAGQVTFTLPAPAAGLYFTFNVQIAQEVIIQASNNAKIRNGANLSASNGKTSASTIGNSVTLVAMSGTEWDVVSAIGAWTIP